MARKNVREMKAPQQESESPSVGVNFKPENVQKVSGRKPGARDTGISCHRCGRPDHLATNKVCHVPMQKEGTSGSGVSEQAETLTTYPWNELSEARFTTSSVSGRRLRR